MAYDIYLMPGLGLAPHIFDRLSLPSGKMVYLRWLEPEKWESFSAYVARIARQIVKGDQPIALIGHSFGGIVMQALQQTVGAEKLVLISTITSPAEIPSQLLLLKYLKFHRLLRANFLSKSIFLWGRRHGYNSPELQTLFSRSAAQLSSYYFQWAVEQILHWPGASVDCAVLRIHGTHDRTFPYQQQFHAHVLEGGDHLAVYTHGLAISQCIARYLTEKPTVNPHSFSA